MKLAIFALALASSSPTAEATEAKAAPQPLQLRSKAAIAATLAHADAPYVNPLLETDLALGRRADPRHAQSRSSCATQSVLCYDAESGRLVYKPARQYMPDIPGLQRENISIKRDRIILRYSF